MTEEEDGGEESPAVHEESWPGREMGTFGRGGATHRTKALEDVRNIWTLLPVIPLSAVSLCPVYAL